MKAACIRKYITQPAGWWEAFEQAASNEGQSVSEWLGRAALKTLPREQREKLQNNRRGVGRPRTN